MQRNYKRLWNKKGHSGTQQLGVIRLLSEGLWMEWVTGSHAIMCFIYSPNPKMRFKMRTQLQASCLSVRLDFSALQNSHQSRGAYLNAEVGCTVFKSTVPLAGAASPLHGSKWACSACKHNIPANGSVIELSLMTQSMLRNIRICRRMRVPLISDLRLPELQQADTLVSST